MKNERTGHPANWLHGDLFDIPGENITANEWVASLGEVIAEIRNLEDSRSVASVCFTVALALREKSANDPDNKNLYEEILMNEVTPLWEREIKKEENWMHIPDNVLEYASIIGGDKASGKLVWGAAEFKKALPTPTQVEFEYPDENIANGIEAVMRGKKGYYFHMMELYKFCDIIKDVAGIIKFAEENSLNDVATEWAEVKNYFDDLLLKIDLVRVDPRLVENMYKNIKSTASESTPIIAIEKQVVAWKFARYHVWERRSEQSGYTM